MLVNNYDKSSTGIDMELNLFFDTWQSQIDWDENFERIERSDHVFFYCDFGNYSLGNIEYTVKGTVKDMRHYLKNGEIRHYYDDSEVNKLNKSELIETILEWFDVNLTNLERSNSDLTGTNLEIVTNPELLSCDITGYSQGDYATIYYHPDAQFDGIKEQFTNLFYDAPIYASLEVNGEEYLYESEDMYSWDREHFIEWAMKETGQDISDMVPDYPDYR